MTNDCNFKSSIVSKESPLVKIAKIVMAPHYSQRETASMEKTSLLEVYVDDKKYGIEYLVLTGLSLFSQILDVLCLDTEMEHLYKHFDLQGKVLLSIY